MKKTINQKGFSLIELMIGIVIGLFITGVVIALFTQSKRNYNQDEEIARLQENGRYALQVISRDLALAGFLGNVQIADDVVVNLPPNAPCGINWHDAAESPLLTPIKVFDVSYPSCIPASSGSQALVIKHAKGSPTTSPGIGNLILSSNGKDGSLYVTSTTATDPAYQYWDFLVHAYYIGDEDNDGIPGLYRKRIIADSTTSLSIANDGELVPGVQDFRVTFGLDSSGDDGIADTYTMSPTAAELATAVSARLDLLVRSTNADISYTNDKTYFVGSTSLSGYGFTDENGNVGKFYGRVFSTTVQMRNIAFRIQMSNLTP